MSSTKLDKSNHLSPTRHANLTPTTSSSSSSSSPATSSLSPASSTSPKSEDPIITRKRSSSKTQSNYNPMNKTPLSSFMKDPIQKTVEDEELIESIPFSSNSSVSPKINAITFSNKANSKKFKNDDSSDITNNNNTNNISTNGSDLTKKLIFAKQKITRPMSPLQQFVHVVKLVSPDSSSEFLKLLSVPLAPDSLKIGRQNVPKVVNKITDGFFDSRVLSRNHAELFVQDNQLYIRDLKSSNGTFINDEKLEPHKNYQLKIGDKIDLGTTLESQWAHKKITCKVAEFKWISLADYDSMISLALSKGSLESKRQELFNSSFDALIFGDSIEDQEDLVFQELLNDLSTSINMNDDQLIKDSTANTTKTTTIVEPPNKLVPNLTIKSSSKLEDIIRKLLISINNEYLQQQKLREMSKFLKNYNLILTDLEKDKNSTINKINSLNKIESKDKNISKTGLDKNNITGSDNITSGPSSNSSPAAAGSSAASVAAATAAAAAAAITTSTTSSLKGEKDANNDKLKSEINDYKKENTILKDKSVKDNERIKILETEINTIRDHLTTARSHETERLSLIEDTERLNKLVKELEINEQSNYNKIDEFKNHIKSLEDSNNNLKNFENLYKLELENTQKLKDEIKSLKSELNENLLISKKQIENSKIKNENLVKDIETKNNLKLKELSNDLKLKSNEINKLSEENSNLKNDLKNLNKENKENLIKINELNNKNLKREIELTKKISELNKKISDLNDSNKKLSDSNKRLNDSNEKLLKAKSESSNKEVKSKQSPQKSESKSQLSSQTKSQIKNKNNISNSKISFNTVVSSIAVAIILLQLFNILKPLMSEAVSQL
ncbi:hypothetical protein B5S33_g786 [[Candida] boidinii]|nr:hypothetical protein B5S27_g405 [[Candida] boidinii]OWB82164.1 hypothetical protein B5S33_g786 [[Candida] boidinii]